MERVELRDDEGKEVTPGSLDGVRPVLIMKKARKSYKKGGITKTQTKEMVPFLDGLNG